MTRKVKKIHQPKPERRRVAFGGSYAIPDKAPVVKPKFAFGTRTFELSDIAPVFKEANAQPPEPNTPADEEEYIKSSDP